MTTLGGFGSDTSLALALFGIREKSNAAGENLQFAASKILNGLYASGYETVAARQDFLSRVKFGTGMIVVGSSFQTLQGSDGDDVMWGGSDSFISGGAGNNIL